jgi:hypothetical protein
VWLVLLPKWIRNAENDLDVQMIFSIDEAADLLLETGYKKPLKLLGMSDRENLQSVLLLYHCVLKVKAEMDQFREGLSSLGVLTALQSNSSLMKCFFQLPTHRLSAEGLKSMFTVKFSKPPTEQEEQA